MGRVGGAKIGRASLLTASPLARTGPADWNAWSLAAIAAARAGIQRSIQHAYLGDGSVKPGDGSVRPGAVLPAGGLHTSYDFSADMHRALVGSGLPASVAAAFTEVTAETFYGWAGALSLGAMSAKGPPHALAQATSTEQWRLALPAIEGALRERLLLPASDPTSSTALRHFANWLSTSLTRWKAGATITKLGGDGVVSGPFV